MDRIGICRRKRRSRFAPRVWGWTDRTAGQGRPLLVCPTRVGMDRAIRIWPTTTRTFAPRVWGWTGIAESDGEGFAVCPTPVGMDRRPCASRPTSLVFAPRVWGWTVDHGQIELAHPGSLGTWQGPAVHNLCHSYILHRFLWPFEITAAQCFCGYKQKQRVCDRQDSLLCIHSLSDCNLCRKCNAAPVKAQLGILSEHCLPAMSDLPNLSPEALALIDAAVFFPPRGRAWVLRPRPAYLPSAAPAARVGADQSLAS
jgi:hypothetical protein